MPNFITSVNETLYSNNNLHCKSFLKDSEICQTLRNVICDTNHPQKSLLIKSRLALSISCAIRKEITDTSVEIICYMKVYYKGSWMAIPILLGCVCRQSGLMVSVSSPLERKT